MSKIIRIDILQYGQIVETFYPADLLQAEQIYRAHSQNENEYTRLTIDKLSYTIAQAERLFQFFLGSRKGGDFNVY